jgi:hypothetical protein
MTPVFALTGNSDNPERHGFDPFVNPKTLIVPSGAENFIGLYDAEGMTVSESDPSIVKIVKNEPGKVTFERKITLKGISEGTAFIEVKKNNIVQTRLEVGVLKRKQVSISFHFVKDNSKHKTRRLLSQIFSLMTELNKIYTPQANIEFILKSSRIVKVKTNLGDQVNFPEELYKGEVKTGKKEWDAITKLGDKLAGINVFFVHLLATNEYLKTCKDKKHCGDLNGYHAFKNCMIADDVVEDEFAAVVAHEIGHALGIVEHNPLAYYLMSKFGTVQVLIPKAESVQMNLSAISRIKR